MKLVDILSIILSLLNSNYYQYSYLFKSLSLPLLQVSHFASSPLSFYHFIQGQSFHENQSIMPCHFITDTRLTVPVPVTNTQLKSNHLFLYFPSVELLP